MKYQLDAQDFDEQDSNPRLVRWVWVGIAVFWIAVAIWLVRR